MVLETGTKFDRCQAREGTGRWLAWRGKVRQGKARSHAAERETRCKTDPTRIAGMEEPCWWTESERESSLDCLVGCYYS